MGVSLPTKKGGMPNEKISIRTAPDGRKYEWHPTKGFRRWIPTKDLPLMK